MFRPRAEAPARATRVAAVLEGAGHKVTLRPLGRTPAALYRVVRDSPEVVHACGVRSWRVASVAARLTGAAFVYEALAEGGGDGLGLPRRAIRLRPRGRPGSGRPSGARVQGGNGSAEPAARGHRARVRWRGARRAESSSRSTIVFLSSSPPAGGREATAHSVGTAPDRRGWRAVRGGGLLHPLALASYLLGRGRRARGRPRKAARALARARRGDPANARYGLELARPCARAASATKRSSS